MSTETVTDTDAMKCFDMIDVNGDEKVEFDEFMSIFKETASQNDMNLFEYMFNCIDKDGSETIETEEIKKIVDDNKVNFSKEELNNLIAKIDADNSGAVDQFVADQLHPGVLEGKQDSGIVKKYSKFVPFPRW